MTALSQILCINTGSSSIKFTLYSNDADCREILTGKIERMGIPGTTLRWRDLIRGKDESLAIQEKDEVAFLLKWLFSKIRIESLVAVAHRIVHGMQHIKPEWINDTLLKDLMAYQSIDMDHLPQAIRVIQLFQKTYPALPQLACFDTAFHADMPAVARTLPIPYSFTERGILRYGFHGLSYAYLLEEIRKMYGEEMANGKIIMAHLGNGASITALREGKSMDTSMGFTPTGGIPMSTRTGDLDPGVCQQLWKWVQGDSAAFNHLINKESGLLGISGISADMEDLLNIAAENERAALAIEVFCYQVRKWIGAFTTVLKGLDCIVFSGGIGEHSAVIRRKICEDLGFMGVKLNAGLNDQHSSIISSPDSNVLVSVIPANEEKMMAASLIIALQQNK